MAEGDREIEKNYGDTINGWAFALNDQITDVLAQPLARILQHINPVAVRQLVKSLNLLSLKLMEQHNTFLYENNG